MNKLKIELTNCFGIENLTHEFDFSTGNVFSIYARNGLMKTSFANTFQCLQRGKEGDICDKIFGHNGSASVRVDGDPICAEQIFVIKSFESAYEANITALLVKDDVQEMLKEVLTARTTLLKALEKASGLKIRKTYQGKEIYELEPQIIEDYAFEEKSILPNLPSLVEDRPEVDFSDIQYNTIFDPSVIKKITDPKFQHGITEFISASDRIYDSFKYLEKGHLTLPKLKDVGKTLEKDSFFVRDNQVTLTGRDSITDIITLNNHISAIETQIRQLPAYQEIEKLLSDTKGAVLKDVIETHPEIIEYLSRDKLNSLRKILWGSYIKANNGLFTDLFEKYHVLSEAIDAIQMDDTPWKRAVDIFNQRFSVPFIMSVDNLKSAIIGESVPHVKFKFDNGTNERTIDRSDLEELDTLSQGEKRALYLLNIIFDIEKLKGLGRETVLVVDDIADSFDYKNKYAIIEYLYELAQEPNFYILILTHNFDFYRTVSSRLGLDRRNRLVANIGETLQLKQEHYQNQPFIYWKQHPTVKNILALIPFLRNLIEYGVDRDISCTGEDFIFLTSLLHEKQNSHAIKFSDINPLYQEYLGMDSFNDVVPTDLVLDKLFSICESITTRDTELENKIVLAMGIRHKAEKFMIREIAGYEGQLNWENHRANESKTGSEILVLIADSKNQTRKLLKVYKQFGDDGKIEVLDEVSIMTPEHIHVNSFMYEPLLDMDINELLGLYQRVSAL